MRTRNGVDFSRLRADFPVLRAGGESLHYLDSAASSQKPDCVIDAISNCYRNSYGPVHRGLYPLAENASEQYETARHTLAQFIHAENTDDVVFTRSATEAINLVATGWAQPRLKPGDEIWVSQMEHHANFLPWQRVCQQSGATLRVIPLDESGRLDLQSADTLFSNKTRLIAVTHVSNVLGVINPIKHITDQAARYSIPVLVDAAQSVGHMPVDVQALGCDFLVASAHKMCGPCGIGLLYGKTQRLQETEPLLLGGGMVDEVGDECSSWADIPACFEAGSPNLSGALGFSAAAEYLREIGRDNIEAHVKTLTAQARDLLANLSGVTVYGPHNANECSGIVAFNVEDIHPHDVAQIAGEQGVAMRAGHHCCQPLMQYLGVSSTARVSFSFYNNEQDIAALREAIKTAQQIFGSD